MYHNPVHSRIGDCCAPSCHFWGGVHLKSCACTKSDLQLGTLQKLQFVCGTAISALVARICASRKGWPFDASNALHS